MLTYRATIRPRSALRSPWRADTLFGHLCWQIYYAEGQAALLAFLEPFQQGAPPLIFSDGFPGDELPRPLLPQPSATKAQTKDQRVAAMETAKAAKAIRWVSREEFHQLRHGQAVALERRPERIHADPVLKNQINRLTGGTTPIDEVADGGGNLYTVEELAFVDRSDGLHPKPVDITLYVRAADAAWAARAEGLLRSLAQTGYGAKKSAGYGHFQLANWEPCTDFDTLPPQANGFISLSHWVPARSDPTRGFYETFVKYGKLGEERANSENPFKLPLVMLTAGSTFYTADPRRAWYGRLVEQIAPGAPDVVQYGYAFAVAAYCVEA